MQIKDLAESLVHSEATQSVSTVIAVNIKPKKQRQDQGQGLRYYERRRWVFTDRSRIVTGPEMIHG